jgi:hypothetical protein
MLVIHNCLDSQKGAPGSHSEAHTLSSHDGDQAVNIKVEEFSDVEDREDPVPMTFVGVKAEHEVSLCPLLGISRSHPELCVPCLICIRCTELLSSLGNR